MLKLFDIVKLNPEEKQFLARFTEQCVNEKKYLLYSARTYTFENQSFKLLNNSLPINLLWTQSNTHEANYCWRPFRWKKISRGGYTSILKVENVKFIIEDGQFTAETSKEYVIRWQAHDTINPELVVIPRNKKAMPYHSVKFLEDGIKFARVMDFNLKNPTFVDVSPLKKFSFTLMEYISGKDLIDLILEEQQSDNVLFDVKQRLNCSKKIFQQIRKIHANNIIHLDIKPENIRYDEHKLRVFDFDASIKAGKKDDYVRGTKDFIAPEVMRLAHVKESDLYSAGVTMGCLWRVRDTDDVISYSDISQEHADRLKELFIKLIDYNPFARGTVDSAIETISEIQFERRLSQIDKIDVKYQQAVINAKKLGCTLKKALHDLYEQQATASALDPNAALDKMLKIFDANLPQLVDAPLAIEQLAIEQLIDTAEIESLEGLTTLAAVSAKVREVITAVRDKINELFQDSIANQVKPLHSHRTLTAEDRFTRRYYRAQNVTYDTIVWDFRFDALTNLSQQLDRKIQKMQSSLQRMGLFAQTIPASQSVSPDNFLPVYTQHPKI